MTDRTNTKTNRNKPIKQKKDSIIISRHSDLVLF